MREHIEVSSTEQGTPCSLLRSTKEHYLPSKEPYILAQEPYILAKEPYMHSQRCESRDSRGCTVKCTSKEPYLLSKGPYILAQEPYILAKEPYMHSQSVSHEAPEDAPLSTFLKQCLFRVRIRVVRTEYPCHVCVCVCV